MFEALAKSGKVDLRDKGGEPVFGISRFVPMFGDDGLPVTPVEALGRSAGRDVELLIGINANRAEAAAASFDAGDIVVTARKPQPYSTSIRTTVSRRRCAIWRRVNYCRSPTR